MNFLMNAAGIAAAALLGSHQAGPPSAEAVPSTQVRITGGLLAERQRVNSDSVLWANFEQCEKTGRIANFNEAARAIRMRDGAGGGERPARHIGFYFNDSDVYKAIEGACCVLSTSLQEEGREKERDRVLAYLDDLIARIAAAQEADGYLYTKHTIDGLEKRWTNMKDLHELYCAGHLFEAAVAHKEATGKDTLMVVARRLADHVCDVFGPAPKKVDVCGHPEVEIGLIRLGDATGEKRYPDLARFFVETRGRAEGRTLFGEYAQDHAPIREHDEVVGHAVRAMYLYTAAAELCRREPDEAMEEALDRVWDDVTLRKMYITGGIGSSAANEGFTTAYDLPNDAAYAETCAGIGLFMWAHKMALLREDGMYADVMERALYNGILSGVSLDGKKFLYVNPLGSTGQHHRKDWYACACCPPNILRLLGSLGGYMYAADDAGVYVNLYASSRATVSRGGAPDVEDKVVIIQETDYPWNGLVKLRVESEKESEWEMRLRVPGWCRAGGTRVSVNGEPIQVVVRGGYVRVRRGFKHGEVVEITFDLPVERVRSHPAVKPNAGRFVLQRGPVVYCLESADNPGGVRTLAVTPDSVLREDWIDDVLGGVTAVRGMAERAPGQEWLGNLYQASARSERVNFCAVPYFAWDNRHGEGPREGEMVVWIPEAAGLAQPVANRGMTAFASHCWEMDAVEAICDGEEPSSSNDGQVKRQTWWPRKGTLEWVSVQFPMRWRVSGLEVYWFSDANAGGGCDAPESWTLEYFDGKEWAAVEMRGGYGVELDRFNRVNFKPVETTALRVKAKLKQGKSAGVLEVRIRP